MKIFFLMVLYLIFFGIASAEMRSIAEMKGHSHSKYFWYCFLLPVFGFIMVAALPDRGNMQCQRIEKLDEDELPDL